VAAARRKSRTQRSLAADKMRCAGAAPQTATRRLQPRVPGVVEGSACRRSPRDEQHWRARVAATYSRFQSSCAHCASSWLNQARVPGPGRQRRPARRGEVLRRRRVRGQTRARSRLRAARACASARTTISASSPLRRGSSSPAARRPRRPPLVRCFVSAVALELASSSMKRAGSDSVQRQVPVRVQ